MLQPILARLSTPCNGFCPQCVYNEVALGGEDLSTPCNGFVEIVDAYVPERWILSTPCNGFLLILLYELLDRPPELSTPCNGFIQTYHRF